MPSSTLKGGKNPELAPGVRQRGRRHAAARAAAHIKKHGLGKKVKPEKRPQGVTKKFGKKGAERVVASHKGQRFYPTEAARTVVKRHYKLRAQPLRASLTPGTVCILLSGKYRGRRVVFLKQLESGLLLVNGPFKLNGVPLRRVAQAYVIATKTKIDMSGVKVDEKINDEFFKPAKAKVERSNEDLYLKRAKPAKTELSAERKALQKATDDALLAAIKKVELLGAYLSSRFTLTNGQYPHTLEF